MTDKLKHLIEMHIEEIDNNDFAALFLTTIQDDTVYYHSHLSSELYDLLTSIGISDQEIYDSSSNQPAMLKRLENIFKERNKSDIKPLVAWTFQDKGSSKSYVDYAALVKYKNNVYPRNAAILFGPNEVLKNEESAFMTFIKYIETLIE